ncbi:hypothetical protein Syun_020540 [Stephania yunnanensis]|uniref:Uncharacterized protein n=1 Tax=Stephania yunnanensis TaxID=152371 RepID=A0AAP0IE40_9MAGN
MRPSGLPSPSAGSASGLFAAVRRCTSPSPKPLPRQVLDAYLSASTSPDCSLKMEMILIQIDKEQTELAKANFSILRKEAQAILDLVHPNTCVFASTTRDHPIHLWDATSGSQHKNYVKATCFKELMEIFETDLRRIVDDGIRDGIRDGIKFRLKFGATIPAKFFISYGHSSFLEICILSDPANSSPSRTPPPATKQRNPQIIPTKKPQNLNPSLRLVAPADRLVPCTSIPFDRLVSPSGRASWSLSVLLALAVSVAVVSVSPSGRATWSLSLSRVSPSLGLSVSSRRLRHRRYLSLSLGSLDSDPLAMNL